MAQSQVGRALLRRRPERGRPDRFPLGSRGLRERWAHVARLELGAVYGVPRKEEPDQPRLRELLRGAGAVRARPLQARLRALEGELRVVLELVPRLHDLRTLA